MAKQTYTKEERKVQFLKTGIEIAKTKGIMEVSGASVAKKNKVTAPLVFHVFGSRDKLRKAVIDKLPQRDKAKAEAALAEVKARNQKRATKKPAPKRKRSVAEVKAIKNKAAATKKVTRSAKDGKFVTKATAKKRPATTITQTVTVKSPKPKKFATAMPPSVNPEANPSDTQ